MATKDEQLQELAARYAAGQCTPEELRRINAWYECFETNGKVLPPADEISRAAEEATLAALTQIRMGERKRRIRQLWLPLMKLAAVLLLISSITIIIYRAAQPVPVSWQWQEVRVAPGAQKQLTMPDGSVISLNGGSSIRYPSTFCSGRREIELQGEAFFEVVHDVKHPFIVHTRQLNIQVLGTSYNVQAYPDDDATKVGVLTGRVGVTDHGKQIPKAVFLTPGQQLTYAQTGFSRSTVALAAINAWQQQVLEFKGETMEQISKVLARTYGVTFVFKDRSLLNKRFQFRSKKESLANILKLLSITGGNFPYRITGRQVILGATDLNTRSK
ncbi:FecR family protein [Mucilaginibacter oryzae]|uniref:FecR family protein n=1 Tax=Mucilaginibacter oryzae TaxID=468058 RepID=A0A316HQ39_9SPHI|nr:FecR family protein [Mucilaginibacter oryzae]PWK77062.1 FecR family protein [Mucilaginibacter oryzae]